MNTPDSEPIGTIHSAPDYAKFLLNNGIHFKETEHHLHIGEPTREQGWILHISVSLVQADQLMELLLPSLAGFRLPFKIVKTSALHQAYNNGTYGDYKVGKILTIYLDKETDIEALTDDLLDLTKGFTGPKVASDFRIGEILYARYGTFIPHIKEDRYGNPHRVVMDKKGQWIMDKYTSSPKLPEGITNPFQSYIDRMPSNRIDKVLKEKYKITGTQRSNVGVSYFTAISASQPGPITYYLIKRAKRGALEDETGRDALDRLKWQYRVTLDLQPYLPVSKVVDYWEDDRQGFLVLESIPKHQTIADQLPGFSLRSWKDLPKKQRLTLTRYILDIIDILKEMHQRHFICGFIHPSYFFINEDDKVNLSQLEQPYSVEMELPGPPFISGARGFRSPAREAREKPVYKDDIYAFGTLLLNLVSGISPYRLIEKDQENFRVKLTFLLANEILVRLILWCVSEDPAQRPPWEIIQENILELRTDIEKEAVSKGRTSACTQDELKRLTTQAIQGLTHSSMLSGRLWTSAAANPYDREIYPLGNRHTFINLYQGASGILYVLGKAGKLGYDISSLTDPINASIELIIKKDANEIRRISSGLYFGTAGLAVALASLIQNGILPNESPYPDLIRQYLRGNNLEYDVAYGIAGNGLAILQCRPFFDQVEWQHLAGMAVEHLVRSQNQEGAWKQKDQKNGSDELCNGFAHGVAGIASFLLDYGYQFHEQGAINAANRGLTHLERAAIHDQDEWSWPISNLDNKRNIWWGKGSLGIAHAFLKSFEYSGNREHLLIAEKTIRKHGLDEIFFRLGQYKGFSGLGEVCLEAFRITKDQEWYDRAGQVAQYLCAMKFKPEKDKVYWLTENTYFPTPDLMTGCSGVIHFLMRYQQPDKVFFPLLPEPAVIASFTS